LATLHGVVAFAFPTDRQGTQKCHRLQISLEVAKPKQPFGETVPKNLINVELENTA